MARLVITSADSSSRICELNKPLTTVGRGTANDLVLNDSSVSRLHAVIKLESDGRVLIADRGSTNGVIVRGERISCETQLQVGVPIGIGSYEITLEPMQESEVIVQKSEMPEALRNVFVGRELTPKSSIQVDEAPHPGRGADTAQLFDKFLKLQKENMLLRLLYDAGKALNSRLSVDDIIEQIMELTFRVEGVERSLLMFLNEKGEIERQSDVRYRTTPLTQQPKIIFSRSILDRIRRERQPILITDLGLDERFAGSESMKISGLRSAMCAPLISPSRGVLLGVLYADNLEKISAFTQEEVNVFAVVASQAAAAIDNTLAHKRLLEESTQRRALERFLAPEVVEMIAANPEGIRLGGANQRVTIFFTDIRGFTTLSETLPPEKIVEILNEFFSRITDVIFDHGGTLDKYIGDAAMAIFGAPISKGHDAANAIRAALEIQRLIVELNRDAADRGHPEIGVGIGINSGIVTAGNIGSAKRLDYTVIGDAVNVASRLCGKAAPGEILISESTASELVGAFRLEALPPVQVKGKSEAIRIYSVPWQTATVGA